MRQVRPLRFLDSGKMFEGDAMAGEKGWWAAAEDPGRVFDAFSELLAEKPYDRITIQEIITKERRPKHLLHALRAQ